MSGDDDYYLKLAENPQQLISNNVGLGSVEVVWQPIRMRLEGVEGCEWDCHGPLEREEKEGT